MRCFFLITILSYGFIANAAVTVSGTLTDYLSGSGIDSCRVLLNPVSPSGITDSARSDAGGVYRFTNINSGIYNIVVTDDRYVSDTMRVTIESDMAVPFALLEAARVLDSLPDTLYKERSPYFVRKEVAALRPLHIQPGVTVRFVRSGKLRIRDSLSAIGTESDSIVFIVDEIDNDSLFNETSDLWLDNYGDGTFKFAFCRFDGFLTLFAHGYSNLAVNNCLFTRMRTALSLDDHSLGFEVIFSHNTVIDCRNGVTTFGASLDYDGDPFAVVQLTISDNVIRCAELALSASIHGSTQNTVRRMLIQHNTISGISWFNGQYAESDDSIVDNIFSEIRFRNVSDKTPFFAYNAFETGSVVLPPGIGIPALVNVNGDSCDYYYNIKMNPRIADTVTGALFAGSPCIGAALDGTSIGVYQGEPLVIGQKHHDQMTRNTGGRLNRLLLGRKLIYLPQKAYALVSGGNATVSLCTIGGQRVSTKENTRSRKGQMPVPPRDIASGQYVLRIKGAAGTCCFPVLLR